MRPRKVRTINRALVAAGLVVLAATATGTARADGYLSDAEAAFVIAHGPTAICPTIAKYPSVGGVMGVAQGIMDQGWSAGDSADIVNHAVAEYCPRFYPLLVAIGNSARADQAGYLA